MPRKRSGHREKEKEEAWGIKRPNGRIRQERNPGELLGTPQRDSSLEESIFEIDLVGAELLEQVVAEVGIACEEHLSSVDEGEEKEQRHGFPV